MPKLPNLSLVAFYGDKPSPLTDLITDLQQYLRELDLLSGKFTSYQLPQVHATLIGCEGWKTPEGIVSQWWYAKRNQTKYLDVFGLIDYLNSDSLLPLHIRIGGYQSGRNYNFLSRNQHPFLRSFQLQSGGTGVLIPVLIGWSFQDRHITCQIDRLRRAAQEFNLLHKYHNTPEAIDNDFYLRLGTIKGQFAPETIEAIAHQVRKLLAERTPIDVTLDRPDLAFAQYQDLTLTPATTEIVPLTQATAEVIQGLYSI